MTEDIHFGKVDNLLPEWRNFSAPGEDDDNDEDNPIENDVKSVLGFDPDE